MKKELNTEVKIKVPEGYEIDKENSTFECIKFKPIKVINKWEEIENICGFYIDNMSKILFTENHCTASHNQNVFIDAKHAKAALAMAKISQLMPYYGGAFTQDEWENANIIKYTITKLGKSIEANSHWNNYHFLAFRTKEDMDRFIKHNSSLIRDYFLLG